MIKNVLVIIFITLCTISAFGQLRFGAGISSDLDRIGVQAKSLINLENIVDLPLDGAATLSYFFKNNSQTLFVVDIDGHYRVMEISDNIELGSVSGLHIARISTDFANQTTNSTGIGINVGAQLTFDIEELLIYVQPKVVLSGGLTGFVLSGGIMF